MKITTYISVAAMMAMLAANTSCTKEETIAPEENKNIITLNVSTETLSRISLTEEGASGSEEVKVKWEEGDELEVWVRPEIDASSAGLTVLESTKFIISSGWGTKNATFSGTLPDADTPDYLNVVYRKNTNNNQLKQRLSTLNFQVPAYPQLLTTELNEAPLVLGGLFKKQLDGTYSPVGGKMAYGGALFKIEIKGLTASKYIEKMIFKNVNTSKWLGSAPEFNYVGDNIFGSTGAGGINGSIELIPTSNSSVSTDELGSVTVYSFIAPHTKNKISTDYDVYIKYVDDDTEHKVGVINFVDNNGKNKIIEYGKCYTVTLNATAVTAQ